MARIEINLVRTARGVAAVGWAAPRGGPLPCAVRLLAGSTLLAVGRATRYSAQAARKGLRLGWCGLRVSDLSAGAALDDEVQLVCAASGDVLVRWPAAEVMERAPSAPRPRQTVAEYRDALLRAVGCEDPDTIMPFIHHLQRMRGDLAVVSACYRWILHRTPELEEARQFLDAITDGDVVGTATSRLLGSEEYLINRHLLAGPFDGAFPFGLAALDEA